MAESSNFPSPVEKTSEQITEKRKLETRQNLGKILEVYNLENFQSQLSVKVQSLNVPNFDVPKYMEKLMKGFNDVFSDPNIPALAKEKFKSDIEVSLPQVLAITNNQIDDLQKRWTDDSFGNASTERSFYLEKLLDARMDAYIGSAAKGLKMEYSELKLSHPNLGGVSYHKESYEKFIGSIQEVDKMLGTRVYENGLLPLLLKVDASKMNLKYDIGKAFVRELTSKGYKVKDTTYFNDLVGRTSSLGEGFSRSSRREGETTIVDVKGSPVLVNGKQIDGVDMLSQCFDVVDQFQGTQSELRRVRESASANDITSKAKEGIGGFFGGKKLEHDFSYLEKDVEMKMKNASAAELIIMAREMIQIIPILGDAVATNASYKDLVDGMNRDGATKNRGVASLEMLLGVLGVMGVATYVNKARIAPMVVKMMKIFPTRFMELMNQGAITMTNQTKELFINLGKIAKASGNALWQEFGMKIEQMMLKNGGMMGVVPQMKYFDNNSVEKPKQIVVKIKPRIPQEPQPRPNNIRPIEKPIITELIPISVSNGRLEIGEKVMIKRSQTSGGGFIEAKFLGYDTQREVCVISYDGERYEKSIHQVQKIKVEPVKPVNIPEIKQGPMIKGRRFQAEFPDGTIIEGVGIRHPKTGELGIIVAESNGGYVVSMTRSENGKFIFTGEQKHIKKSDMPKTEEGLLGRMKIKFSEVMDGVSDGLASIRNKFIEQRGKNIRINSEKIGTDSMMSKLWEHGLEHGMKQGPVGNCYFVAALNAIKESPDGYNILKSMIRDSGDGGWIIKFKGIGTGMKIYPNELDDMGEYKIKGQSGDYLLEYAYARLRTQKNDDFFNLKGGYIERSGRTFMPIGYTEKGRPKFNHEGGYLDEVYSAFFGKEGIRDISYRDMNRYDASMKGGLISSLKDLSGDELVTLGTPHAKNIKDILRVYFPDDTPSELKERYDILEKSGDVGKFPIKDIYGETHYFNFMHAYNIGRYDINAGWVEIINPHNTLDKRFRISIDNMMRYFDEIMISKLK